jgi:hypothetical protein
MQAKVRNQGSSGYRYVTRAWIRGTLYWRGVILPKKGFNTKRITLPDSTLGAFTPQGAESVARAVDVELVKLNREADTTFFIGEDGVEVARLLVR